MGCHSTDNTSLSFSVRSKTVQSAIYYRVRKWCQEFLWASTHQLCRFVQEVEMLHNVPAMFLWQSFWNNQVRFWIQFRKSPNHFSFHLCLLKVPLSVGNNHLKYCQWTGWAHWNKPDTQNTKKVCVFCLYFKGIHQFSNLAKEQVLEQHWALIVPHFSAQAPLHLHWEPGRALGRQPDVFSQSWHCTLLPFGQSEIKKKERRGTWSTWLFPRIYSKSPSQWSSAILGCIKATLELRVV